MPYSPESPEAAWVALVQAYQLCTRKYEQMLSHLDLTTAQFDVMTNIRRLGREARPKHLAARLLVTRANVSSVLDRLRQRGLVRLVAHPEDGRARIVSLTDEGDRLLSAAMPAAKRFVEAQLAPFSAEDIAQTRRVMEKMQRHLATLDPEALSGSAVDAGSEPR